MSKISELSDGGAIQSGDTLIAVRSGGNVKVTYGGTTTANIDGGTIDGTVIGGSSAAAGSFTTLSASGEIAANGGIALGDNDKATFGASDDLQIYHDGSNSFIKDSGTGILFIQGSGGVRVLGADTSEALARFNENSSVQLYYDNSEKFSTTATGIDVTGTLVTDAITNSGSSTLAGNIFFNSTSGGLRFQTDAGVEKMTARLSTDDLKIENGSGVQQLLIKNSGGIDVTGTVTADGLTVTTGSASGTVATLKGSTGFGFTLASSGTAPYIQTIGVGGGEELAITSGGTTIALFQDGGDFQLYEPTGTTAKFFWDASAESLGIGTTQTPATLITTSTTSHAGVGIADGYLSIARDLTGSSGSGGVAFLNRLATDGPIVDFRKDGAPVGSIGSYNTELTIFSPAGGDCGMRIGYNAIKPANSTGANADAVHNLGEASGRWKDLYLSGGVYLGGTGAANHLDDYEEGQWTPEYAGTTTAGVGTYTFQEGSYIKVGNLVTVNGYFRSTAHTGTGNITISNLPFTVSAGNDEYGVLNIGECFNLGKSADTVLTGYANPSSTYITLRQITTAATTTVTSSVPMDTGFDILFTCTYRTV